MEKKLFISSLFLAALLLALGFVFSPLPDNTAFAATSPLTKLVEVEGERLDTAYKNPSLLQMPSKKIIAPVMSEQEKVPLLSRIHAIVVGITALIITIMTLFLFFIITSSQRPVRRLARMIPVPLFRFRLRKLKF